MFMLLYNQNSALAAHASTTLTSKMNRTFSLWK